MAEQNRARHWAYNETGHKSFAGGDGDLFETMGFSGAAHAVIVEGKSTQSKAAKRFIEREGEFNPDEITAEDHEKYEKEREQAEEASHRATDNNNVDQHPFKDSATTIENSVSAPEPQRASSRKLTRATFQKLNGRTINSVHSSKMSFGGGRGGGRGRGGRGLQGATWDYDPDEQLKVKPSDLFPAHPNLKKPKPLTEKEKRQLKAQKKIQEDIRRGPLYTEPTKRDADAPAKTFSEAQFNSQYGSKGKADIDPFHGVETYSMKYAPKKRTIPQLSARPFNKELFPKELWGVLEGDAGEEVKKHINRITEKKSLMLTNSKTAAEKDRIILEKIQAVTGGAEDGDVEEEEEPAEEEEQDYDFEEDENEMGGDYDGERYFDNGEGDSGEEDNAGNDDY